MVAAPRQPDSGAFQPPGLWCPPSAPVLPCQQWSGGAPGPAINIQPPFSVVTWGGPWFVPSGPDVGYWPGPSAVAGEWPVAGAAPCCWTPGAPVGAPAALLGSSAAPVAGDAPCWTPGRPLARLLPRWALQLRLWRVMRPAGLRGRPLVRLLPRWAP